MALVLLGAVPHVARAQSDTREASLQGITQIGVNVNVVTPVAGVDAGAIKNKLVASLQAMGLNVLPNQAEPDNATPVIRIIVSASAGSSGLRSVFVETDVRQVATLNRNAALSAIVVDTWRVSNPPGSIAGGLLALTINQFVEQEINAFKTAYTKANGPSVAWAPLANPQARWVRESCRFHSTPPPTDSGLFAQAVAADFTTLNVPALSARANDILDNLAASSVPFALTPTPGKWMQLNSAQATDLATKGWLVVGGLKNITPPEPGSQGLVVVAVGNPAAGPGDAPLAFWGRSGGNGRQNTPVLQAFSLTELPGVAYFGWKLGN
jgi:hypothetical protein